MGGHIRADRIAGYVRSQVIRSNQDIAVTDQDGIEPAGPVSRDQVVHLGIHASTAGFDNYPDILVRVPVFHHAGDLVGRIVVVLQRKDDLIGLIGLAAEAVEVIKEVVVQTLEGLQDRDGRKGCWGAGLVGIGAWRQRPPDRDNLERMDHEADGRQARAEPEQVCHSILLER